MMNILLKRGSQGSLVKIWQEFLAWKGYGIKADGDFGPNTERSTRGFQTELGLQPDGIVGPNTILAAESQGFKGFGNSEPLPDKARLILVSAGHTNVPGQDRGVAANGLIEGEEALKLRDLIAATLRAKGIAVIEDGADGENQPLKKALALARKADRAVEIHFNGGPPAATGVEVLAKAKHKTLAQAIALGISQATGLKLRGDVGYKSDTSGQHHRLAFCEAGGLIIEVAFLTNIDDVQAYVSNFGKIATAIADAVSSDF